MRIQQNIINIFRILIIVLYIIQIRSTQDLKMSSFADKQDSANGRWTQNEHQKFLLGLELYGRNWKKIQGLVLTRTGSQIRSHAQKFFLRNSKNKDGLDVFSGLHETNDCGSGMAVTAKLHPEHPQTTNTISFFMQNIIKMPTPKSLSLNFWTDFIEVKTATAPQINTTLSLSQTDTKLSFVNYIKQNQLKNNNSVIWINPAKQQFF